MQILVDSSIWIDYFRDGSRTEDLDVLIDENLVVTNDLILAELVPFLRIRKQRKLIGLMHSIEKNEMVIGWEQISDFQYKCLRKGITGVGIPDLVIAQNAKQHHCAIYTLDNHFRMISDILKLSLF